MSEEQQNQIDIRIQKRRPKKNAKTYRIETVNDIFQIMTTKNANKLFREIKAGLMMGVLLREIAVAKAQEEGKEIPKELVTLPYVDWIDD